MNTTLDQFKAALATELFGMTKDEAIAKGICIDCKKPPTFTTELGKKEYSISGLCELCWDATFKES